MKTKITIAAGLTLACGVFVYTRPHNVIPSDLRDAVKDTSAIESLNGAVREAASEAPVPETPFVKPADSWTRDAARELRKELAGYGIAADVTVVSAPGKAPYLLVEFFKRGDYEQVEDLFYQDGDTPGYMGVAVQPRVPKSAAGGNFPDVSRDKGFTAGAAGSPAFPIDWVRIDGGEFMMGSNDHPYDVADAQPAHKVSVRPFQMSRTEVTVEQYAGCVAAGACTAPGKGRACNWGLRGRAHHPVNCVTWDQAVQFAGFKGARLPAEAQWEYAATSGGRNQRYPWGNQEADCEKAVVWTYGKGYGCGRKSTFPVCSKPLGNTAQGLCDMAGNVGEWVQDKYQDSYNGAPSDGSAFESAGFRRVVRGGSFRDKEDRGLRADTRLSRDPRSSDDSGIGFRIVK